MSADISRTASKIQDAEMASDAWPEALKAITDATGAAGAASLIVGRDTGAVEWLSLSGISEGVDAAYADHYSKCDPYAPLLTGVAEWRATKACLSAQFLRGSEWYNDFMLKCGVSDVLGCRVVETRSHIAFFGLHQRTGRVFHSKTQQILEQLSVPLAGALRGQIRRTTYAQHGEYFFHIFSRTTRTRDDLGIWFSTPAAAVAFASSIAAQLARNPAAMGQWIAVFNNQGEEIARVAVEPSPRAADGCEVSPRRRKPA